MPAGPGRCPRHRSWVGRGVCHPVLGPGKEPWVERLWELSRVGERQEEQLGGSRLLVPAQEAPVTGCSQQQTLTSLHCRGQGFASGISYSIGEGSATPEGFGALGEPCLYPEMMRGKKNTPKPSNAITFLVKLTQPQGQLLFRTPKSLLCSALLL